MKTNTETIADDNGIELNVSYYYEESEGHYEEPGNVASYVEPMVYTELKSVELVIAGRGIQILPQLTEREKKFIISKLQYEN